MSTENEAISDSPIATLGNSLNYTSETLESLFDKKNKHQKVEGLSANLFDIIDVVKEQEDSNDPSQLDAALQSLKENSATVQESLKEMQDDALKKISSTVEQQVKSLNKLADNAAAKIKAAIEDDNEDKSKTLGQAQTAFSRVVKEVNTLSTIERQLTENLTSNKDLLLDESEQAADFFLNSIATALFNDILPSDDSDGMAMASIRQKVTDLSADIDEKLFQDLNAIIHDKEFKTLEENWLGLQGLIESTDWSANIMIDVLDCNKEELREDFKNNSVDLTNSDFFKKVYVAEYDQYGGNPYGAIIGLFEFENNEPDRRWLATMGKISAASHAPFISSVGPEFFGCKNIQELAEIKDLDAHMSHPRFEKWQQFRDSEEAPYIGLTLPKFLLRAPYHSENNPAGIGIDYNEKIDDEEGFKDFLWCNAAFLVAKNMISSFAESGWCQYLRGPKGGGLVEHLPRYAFNLNGQHELKSPIEMTIPDYRELQFSNAGFIPLIYRKGTADACFFSCQSIKKPKKFKDPHDSENSQLVTNLSYTFSITRIAHYIKCIMRDNIGSAATVETINNTIQTWLSQYVTTVVNPDDRTLRHYPFKAAKAFTTEREGMVGWYNSEITVLPHLQFEGMDVELKMDVRI
ncbi:type VI secretion system contractile sheath large subunit [Aliikangiella coralliicola]|uniref:Type VI secretion system contractile sheath large subunit n=1 Tax=Aliikangiella coralliicola TaxID=2592383 RepID=A0A545UGA1_9GAMM|nr:type VI secretion system contractile sheath large subunit [Aliikangiella coralliicola]TQV88500.1 type VI secretion system contractile sheath large subunit [Aliikangiella coralliicola]